MDWSRGYVTNMGSGPCSAKPLCWGQRTMVKLSMRGNAEESFHTLISAFSGDGAAARGPGIAMSASTNGRKGFLYISGQIRMEYGEKLLVYLPFLT
jgi:hypothetical protein